MINNTTAAIRKLKLKILSVASHRHVVSFFIVGVGVGADRLTPPPQKKESLQIMKILIRRGWGDRQKQKIYYNFDFTINFLFFIILYMLPKSVCGGDFMVI